MWGGRVAVVGVWVLAVVWVMVLRLVSVLVYYYYYLFCSVLFSVYSWKVAPGLRRAVRPSQRTPDRLARGPPTPEGGRSSRYRPSTSARATGCSGLKGHGVLNSN